MPDPNRPPHPQQADRTGFAPSDPEHPQNRPTAPSAQRAVTMKRAVEERELAPVWFTAWTTEFERKVDADRQLTNAAIQTLNAEVAQLKAATVTRALSMPPPGSALGAIPAPPRQKLPSLTDTEDGEVDPDAVDEEQSERLDAHSLRWLSYEQAIAEIRATQSEVLVELRKGRRENASRKRETKSAISASNLKIITGAALAAITTVCGTWATTRSTVRESAKSGAEEAVREAPPKILPAIVPAPIPSGAP
jgi:hypothetical protein